MSSSSPASFYDRAAAWGLDFWPWMLPVWALGHSLPAWLLTYVACMVGYALLSSFLESHYSTTLGKHLVGLRVEKVVGPTPTRQTWPEALLRHVSAGLSWLTLNLGHVLVLFRQDRKALHDLITQTQVVQDVEEKADLPFLPYITPKQRKYWKYGSLAGQGALMVFYTIYVVMKTWEAMQHISSSYPMP